MSKLSFAFEPQHVQVILKGLSKLTIEEAGPTFAEVQVQLRAQAQPVVPGLPGGEPLKEKARGKGRK